MSPGRTRSPPSPADGTTPYAPTIMRPSRWRRPPATCTRNAPADTPSSATTPTTSTTPAPPPSPRPEQSISTNPGPPPRRRPAQTITTNPRSPPRIRPTRLSTAIHLLTAIRLPTVVHLSTAICLSTATVARTARLPLATLTPPVAQLAPLVVLPVRAGGTPPVDGATPGDGALPLRPLRLLRPLRPRLPTGGTVGGTPRCSRVAVGSRPNSRTTLRPARKDRAEDGDPAPPTDGPRERDAGKAGRPRRLLPKPLPSPGTTAGPPPRLRRMVAASLGAR